MGLTKLWSWVLVVGVALPGFALAQAGGAADETAAAAAEGEAPGSPDGATEAAGDGSAEAGEAAESGEPAEGAESAPAADAASTESGPEPAEKPGTPEASADKPKATAMDGSTYVVRLRDLEARVDELKEQIRRSHTRLSLLSDTILSGGVGGARAEIRFQNDLSSAFRLTRALFVLDGAVQYNKQDDSGELAAQTEIPIFSGAIPPGDHTLQVLLKLRGHGYGVFSYLRGYQFEVKSSHSFTITEGKTIQLDAVAWEQGGVTTPLEQRPAVRYSSKIRSGLGGNKSGGSSGKGGDGKTKASTKLSVGTGAK